MARKMSATKQAAMEQGRARAAEKAARDAKRTPIRKPTDAEVAAMGAGAAAAGAAVVITIATTS